MKRRIISLLICCVILVSLLPQIQLYAAAVQSGKDSNITWTLDDAGTLTISGTGAMPDYSGVAPWFSWRSKITKIEVCDGITSIGRAAFSYCEKLTSVTLPDSVTIIGLGAFRDCYSLTTITIPNGVTSIGNHAFTSCATLTSISIPERVTNIGSSAFLSCDSLTSINVADDNGYYCSENGVLFDKEKTELICYPSGKTEETYIVPNSVTRIEGYAFAYCENLSSITIPKAVRSLPAFVSCHNLTKITVADENPYYCSEDGVLFNKGKTKIVCYPAGRMQETYIIPNGVTSIGDSAFFGCMGLTAVTLPDSVTSIEQSAFFGCTALASIIIPNAVTSINWQAFSKCSSLKTITLPESITSIGDSAFEECSSLKTIMLPDSITSIGGRAFFGCESLTTITISDGITSIGYGMFYDCLSLRSIMLPDSITSIGDSAFFGCDSLSSITIPNSVTSIGDQTFVYCDSLSVVYYGGTKSEWAKINIGNYNDPLVIARIHFEGEEATDVVASDTDGNITWTLDDAGMLTISGTGAMPDYTYPSSAPWESLSSEIVKVEVCDGVTSIGNDAFRGCKTLKSITLPDSVTNIGDGAFAACINLTSIAIPDSVTNIGSGMFNDCHSLISVKLPNAITYIPDYAFSGCESLTSVVIPDSVTSIGEGAFCRCYSLTSITIPESVTCIGDGAFDSCANLSSITIPSSVTSIGDYAFFWCDSLTNIYYVGTKSEWGKISIGGYNDPLTSETIHFTKAPAITYSFAQSVQLGLIEPWFLKANLLVYTTSTSNPIDYSTLSDYGAYFIRASELSDPNATQDSLSAENIINNENAVKRSKKEGTATIDGKFLTAKYDDGIYTYEMSDSIFVLFYIEDENGIQYAPIRERNIKSLLEARKDDAENFPNEFERKVYSAMLEMYEAVTAYREDYYSKN